LRHELPSNEDASVTGERILLSAEERDPVLERPLNCGFIRLYGLERTSATAEISYASRSCCKRSAE
jgi:hypothetical protein